MQCQAVSSSVNQCQAVPRSVNQCQAVSSSVKQCQAVSSSAKQCRAMSISVKQCQAVSISVKQFKTRVCSDNNINNIDKARVRSDLGEADVLPVPVHGTMQPSENGGGSTA